MRVLTYKDSGDKLEAKPYIVALVYKGGTKIERFRFEEDRDTRADELRAQHKEATPA